MNMPRVPPNSNNKLKTKICQQIRQSKKRELNLYGRSVFVGNLLDLIQISRTLEEIRINLV